MDHEGLGIFQIAFPRCGVPHMADGTPPGKPSQDISRGDLGDQPHVAIGVEVMVIGRDNPRALLTPVLQGIEAQIGHVGRLWVTIYTE